MIAPIRIKSFRARNLADALRKVRTELGPDAIILDTKQTQRSRFSWARFSWSRDQIEVTASSGPPPDTQLDPALDEPSPPSDEPIAAEIKTDHPPVESPLLEPAPYPLCFIQVGAELLKRELPRDRVDSWLKEALSALGSDDRDPWVVRAFLAQMLRREISIDPPTRSWAHEKSTVAVVGPPGHGKSSAVAKLASIASLHLGLRPLVISCVHASAPPRPRLADYCDLMEWNYEQVDAPKLASAIASGIDHCDWVVLDIPSIPLGDIESMEMWRSILQESQITQTHLTINATTGTAHAQRLLNWYQGVSPSHLLITHLDEALGLGGFYPFLSSAKLPLGFATFGPDIPNDIVESDSSLIAHWILGSGDDGASELIGY
jgi:flagellar biosynthesis protein FlhF